MNYFNDVLEIYNLKSEINEAEIGRICFKCKKYLLRETSRKFDIYETPNEEPVLSVFCCRKKSCRKTIEDLFPLCRLCGKRYLRKFTIPDEKDINEEERICIYCKE